jgi:hypothetical protein
MRAAFQFHWHQLSQIPFSAASVFSHFSSTLAQSACARARPSCVLDLVEPAFARDGWCDVDFPSFKELNA